MEKPDPDASMGEKMRYLEEGFWESFAEGIAEENESEDENESDGIEEFNQEPDEK